MAKMETQRADPCPPVRGNKYTPCEDDNHTVRPGEKRLGDAQKRGCAVKRPNSYPPRSTERVDQLHSNRVKSRLPPNANGR